MDNLSFVCNICNKKLQHFSSLKRHIFTVHTNKTVKQSVNIAKIYTCEYCDKQFKTKFNLTRHVNSYCKALKSMNQTNTKQDTCNLDLNNKKFIAEKLIEILSSYGNLSLNNIQNINNTQYTTNNINQTLNQTLNLNKNNYTQNIHLNPIGEENLDHITKDDKIAILKQGLDAVPALVKAILSVPENRNIAISNKRKQKVIFINKDGKVEISSLDKVLCLYTTNNIDRIDEFLDEYKHELPEMDRGILRLIYCQDASNEDHFEKYHNKCMDQIQDIVDVNKHLTMKGINKYNKSISI